MDITALKDFQGIIGALTGATLGFVLARVGSKLDKKYNQEKSKEMYYKNYMIYQYHVHQLVNLLHQFIYEKDDSKLNLTRIHRNSEYLKNQFLAFPLEIIPKDIFLLHREFMSIMVSFQLASIMEQEFEGVIVIDYKEKLKEYEEDFKKFQKLVEDIEDHLNVKSIP
ncbi:hypothetical protein LIT25_23910 [Bacillus sp. F19]|nr:hypothetical protein LIT25_23910 [Bacillus sp. F19]